MFAVLSGWYSDVHFQRTFTSFPNSKDQKYLLRSTFYQYPKVHDNSLLLRVKIPYFLNSLHIYLGFPFSIYLYLPFFPLQTFSLFLFLLLLLLLYLYILFPNSTLFPQKLLLFLLLHLLELLIIVLLLFLPRFELFSFLPNFFTFSFFSFLYFPYSTLPHLLFIPHLSSSSS